MLVFRAYHIPSNGTSLHCNVVVPLCLVLQMDISSMCSSTSSPFMWNGNQCTLNLTRLRSGLYSYSCTRGTCKHLVTQSLSCICIGKSNIPIPAFTTLVYGFHFAIGKPSLTCRTAPLVPGYFPVPNCNRTLDCKMSRSI